MIRLAWVFFSVSPVAQRLVFESSPLATLLAKRGNHDSLWRHFKTAKRNLLTKRSKTKSLPVYVPSAEKPEWNLLWHSSEACSLSELCGLSLCKSKPGLSPLFPHPRHQLHLWKCRAAKQRLHTPPSVQSDILRCGGCWAPGLLGASAIPGQASLGCTLQVTPDLLLLLLAPAGIYLEACSESLVQTLLWEKHEAGMFW